MNPSDLFRKALRYLLEEKGMKQVDLAEKISVYPSDLNAFINQRTNFSENKRIQITEALNTTYVDMLILGRKLAENDNGQVIDFSELEEQKLFNSFLDPEIARELCSKLKDIEKHYPEGYEDIFDFVKIKHKKIKTNTKKALKNNSAG